MNTYVKEVKPIRAATEGIENSSPVRETVVKNIKRKFMKVDSDMRKNDWSVYLRILLNMSLAFSESIT